jgi:hypothetical protein
VHSKNSKEQTDGPIQDRFDSAGPEEKSDSEEGDDENGCDSLPKRKLSKKSHRALARFGAFFGGGGFGLCGFGGVAIIRRTTASRRLAASSSL